MIGVVDYGVGNLFSLICSLKSVGGNPCLIRSPKEAKDCAALVLPGVGSFGAAMQKLRDSGLDDALKGFANSGKPLLGICLGMQLLFERSYEFGRTQGLGLIGGEVVSLADALNRHGLSYKIPAIGWNALDVVKPHPLLENVTDGESVYYVHSFYVPHGEYTVAESEYGVAVTGIAARDNVMGCQFHPEKSGETGLKMLRAFVSLVNNGERE